MFSVMSRPLAAKSDSSIDHMVLTFDSQFHLCPLLVLNWIMTNNGFIDFPDAHDMIVKQGGFSDSDFLMLLPILMAREMAVISHFC